MNYSQFWLSILNADLKGIQNYADKLGVGQLYGLFACMVAGRSWSSITKGIDRAEKTGAEVTTMLFLNNKVVNGGVSGSRNLARKLPMYYPVYYLLSE